MAEVVNTDIIKDVNWLNSIVLDPTDENDSRKTEIKEMNKNTKNRK